MPRPKDIFCPRFLCKINGSLYVIHAFRKYFMPRTSLYISALFPDNSFNLSNLLKSPVIECDDGRLSVDELIYDPLHAESGSGEPVYEDNDLLRLGRPEPQTVENNLLRGNNLNMKTRTHTHVPCCHDSRYFFCSGVSSSIFIPIAASLSVDISRSISSGMSYTPAASGFFCVAIHALPSACVERLVSVTLAGWPSAAARFTRRPSARMRMRFLPILYSCTFSRTTFGSPFAIFFKSLRFISTSKCPELHTMAPSFITLNSSAPMTLMFPVTVQKISPTDAALRIVVTKNPSIAASSAFTGSISVTMTPAPIPLARMASPLPHQPYPATTKVLPASSTSVARIMPSSVD